MGESRPLPAITTACSSERSSDRASRSERAGDDDSTARMFAAARADGRRLPSLAFLLLLLLVVVAVVAVALGSFDPVFARYDDAEDEDDDEDDETEEDEDE